MFDRIKKIASWLRHGKKEDGDESPCLIQAWLAEEAKRPPELRRTACHMTCYCPRCAGSIRH
jgi:hypothetical protein